jgi:hypothetical protein
MNINAAEDLCTYKVTVQFEDSLRVSENIDIIDELTITAPCGLDEVDLYDYISKPIKDGLEVVSVTNNEDAYRLSKDEVDYFDSAWGFRGGVPEEEYDEELAAEGYYDDYYEQDHFSGYMYNLQWTIVFKYNGIEFTFEVEDDAWKSADEVIEYAKDCIADDFDILSFEVED